MTHNTTEETEESKKIPLKCPKCKYEWKSRGRMFWITCPKCQKKFKKEFK